MGNDIVTADFDDFLPSRRKSTQTGQIMHRHTVERADGSSFITEKSFEINKFSGIQGSGWSENSKANTHPDDHLRKEQVEAIFKSKTVFDDGRGNRVTDEIASRKTSDTELTGIGFISDQLEDKSEKKRGLLGFDSTISF